MGKLLKRPRRRGVGSTVYRSASVHAPNRLNRINISPSNRIRHLSYSTSQTSIPILDNLGNLKGVQTRDHVIWTSLIGCFGV